MRRWSAISAVAVADVLHGRDDAIEVADTIIGGYVSVTPLEDEEAGLLADLVTARLATEVTVTAWRQRLYPDGDLRLRRERRAGPAPPWMPSRRWG